MSNNIRAVQSNLALFQTTGVSEYTLRNQDFSLQSVYNYGKSCRAGSIEKVLINSFNYIFSSLDHEGPPPPPPPPLASRIQLAHAVVILDVKE